MARREGPHDASGHRVGWRGPSALAGTGAWGFWMLAWAFFLCLACDPASGQPLQPVPALSGRVVDTVGLLAPDESRRIEAKLGALEREKGAQVVFLLVATTAPEDIASYANRVGNTWKVGRRGVGDGVLLVVARDDRAARIEVAKTLEGAIPDLAASQVIEAVITPAFRRGEFAAGLEAAADRLSALVRGEALPAPARSGVGRAGIEGFELTDLAIFALMAVPVAAAMLRRMFGRAIGALVTGGGVGLIALLVTSSLIVAVLAALVGGVVALLGISPLVARQMGRGGRWGGPTGGWGSGRIGGGGFRSGGGGDFGGGGASGRW